MTGWHPSDDDLILHFYGETGAERTRIDAHLGRCPTCRSAWADLRDTLTLVDSAATPDPGAGFERIMWARVQQALPAPPSGWDRIRRFFPLGALAALVLAAVGAAYQWRAIDTAPETGAGATTLTSADGAGGTARTRERVLLTALDSHFEQTEVLLTELMNASHVTVDDGVDLSFERDTADELVFSGRLYRLTALQNGHAHYVRMLDDLETVLIELARGPQRPSSTEVESLRARIDDASLLFKVRAVSDVIHVRQRELMTADD